MLTVKITAFLLLAVVHDVSGSGYRYRTNLSDPVFVFAVQAISSQFPGYNFSSTTRRGPRPDKRIKWATYDPRITGRRIWRFIIEMRSSRPEEEEDCYVAVTNTIYDTAIRVHREPIVCYPEGHDFLVSNETSL